ncbi:hypothetical protein MKW98_005924, partial [Papaver atlanticum]
TGRWRTWMTHYSSGVKSRKKHFRIQRRHFGQSPLAKHTPLTRLYNSYYK